MDYAGDATWYFSARITKIGVRLACSIRVSRMVRLWSRSTMYACASPESFTPRRRIKLSALAAIVRARGRRCTSMSNSTACYIQPCGGGERGSTNWQDATARAAHASDPAALIFVGLAGGSDRSAQALAAPWPDNARIPTIAPSGRRFAGAAKPPKRVD